MQPSATRHLTTRRQALRCMAYLGLVGAGSLLAACQTASAPPAPTVAPTAKPTSAPAQVAPPPTSAPAQAAPAQAAPAATTAPAAPSAATPRAAAKPAPRQGGTLIYGASREPENLDSTRFGGAPAITLAQALYDTLVARAPDNTFQPNLAESWEISPDGKSYTFKLKRNVKFHDGTPFNSKAVKYTFDRTHHPDVKAKTVGAAYGFYETVDTPDDFTAIVRLNRPLASFMDTVSYIYKIVSPTAGDKWGEDLGQHPVGTGPFIFKEWVLASHITVTRNPDYNWGPPMFNNRGPAYLDGVTYRLVTEDGTRVAALDRGELHMIEALPAQELERVNNDKNLKALIGFVPGRAYVYNINMRKPPTNDPLVRQAMNYAANQDAMVRIVFGPFQSLGAMSPAHSVLVPITYGYEKQAGEVFKHDLDKAKSLLEQAGWKPGPDGIRMKDGQRLEVLLATWEHGVAEVLQSQLREAGIDFQIKLGPTATANEMARREEVHMSPSPRAQSDPDVLGTIHSRNAATGSAFNFHGNQHLDDLLDAGATATNEQERLKIYSEIQMILMKDAMYVPLYCRDNVTGARAEVEGVVFNRGQNPSFYDTYLNK